MSGKLAQKSTTSLNPTQTPFERFKAALSTVVSVPKSSLLKSKKKSHKK